MQTTWVKGLQWDDALPFDLKETWQAPHEQLNSLNEIQFCRFFWSGSKKNKELHLIADALEKAYAAVPYSRVKKLDGSDLTKLHACKTNVAPLKSISVPNLELCAALLAARFLKSCLQAISKTRFKVSSIHACSDSTITLAWISGELRRWNTFVPNRVSDIIDVILPSDWKHVPTQFNTAFLASGVTSVLSLMESNLWWSGLEWLAKLKAFWPHKIVSIMRTNLEKKAASFNAMQVRNCLVKLQRFSSAKRLIRTWAFVNRALQLMKRSKRAQFGPLTAPEIQGAHFEILRDVQEESFNPEIRNILSNGQVQKSSPLRNFTPSVDDQGFLRVGGGYHSQKIQKTKSFRCFYQSVIISLGWSSGNLMKKTFIVEHNKLYAPFNSSIGYLQAAVKSSNTWNWVWNARGFPWKQQFIIRVIFLRNE